MDCLRQVSAITGNPSCSLERNISFLLLAFTHRQRPSIITAELRNTDAVLYSPLSSKQVKVDSEKQTSSSLFQVSAKGFCILTVEMKPGLSNVTFIIPKPGVATDVACLRIIYRNVLHFLSLNSRALKFCGPGGPPHVKLVIEWDHKTKEW